MPGDTTVPLMPINVWLAGRSYRLRIPTTDEAAVRRAVKVADQKINELRQHYAGKDDQDFLAMALLMYATTETGTGTDVLEHEEIEEMIRKIDKALQKDPEPPV